MEMIKGAEKNVLLLSIIEEEIEEILKKGSKYKDNASAVKPLTDSGDAFILKEDEDKYNKAMLLGQLLEFPATPANEVYEFPGTNISFGGKDVKTTLYLPISQAKNLANVAKDIETTLTHLDIVFPRQLFQFLRDYESTKGKIPGKNFSAPRPKLASETLEEYEDMLENFYKGKADKVPDETGAFREPYLHERIDYRKPDKYKIGDEAVSEYYYTARAQYLKGLGHTTVAEEGVKHRVTDADVNGLGRLRVPRKARKDDKNDRVARLRKFANIKKVVTTIAAVGAGAIILGNVPALIVPTAIIGTIFVLKHRDVLKKGKKILKERQEKEAKERAEKEEEERKRAERLARERTHEGPTAARERARTATGATPGAAPEHTGPAPRREPAPGPGPGPTGPEETGPSFTASDARSEATASAEGDKDMGDVATVITMMDQMYNSDKLVEYSRQVKDIAQQLYELSQQIVALDVQIKRLIAENNPVNQTMISELQAHKASLEAQRRATIDLGYQTFFMGQEMAKGDDGLGSRTM